MYVPDQELLDPVARGEYDEGRDFGDEADGRYEEERDWNEFEKEPE